MKKSDSKSYNETPEEELKRLRKEIKQLKSRKQADKAKIDEMRNKKNLYCLRANKKITSLPT